jgi:hypothetical protein
MEVGGQVAKCLAGHLSFRFSFNPAIKAAAKVAKVAKRSWRAALAAGFPILMTRQSVA